MKTVEVAGQTFEVDKAAPSQIAGIAKLIAGIYLRGKKEVSKLGLSSDASDLVWGVLSVLDEEDLIRLAALVIGSDEEFARENFDLVWVSDALASLIEETDLGAVIANFTRIVSRTAA